MWFTENETNSKGLYGVDNYTPYTKVWLSALF